MADPGTRTLTGAVPGDRIIADEDIELDHGVIIREWTLGRIVSGPLSVDDTWAVEVIFDLGEFTRMRATVREHLLVRFGEKK